MCPATIGVLYNLTKPINKMINHRSLERTQQSGQRQQKGSFSTLQWPWEQVPEDLAYMLLVSVPGLVLYTKGTIVLGW
jgi:hypothetical protein